MPGADGAAEGAARHGLVDQAIHAGPTVHRDGREVVVRHLVLRRRTGQGGHKHQKARRVNWIADRSNPTALHRLYGAHLHGDLQRKQKSRDLRESQGESYEHNKTCGFVFLYFLFSVLLIISCLAEIYRNEVRASSQCRIASRRYRRSADVNAVQSEAVPRSCRAGLQLARTARAEADTTPMIAL